MIKLEIEIRSKSPTDLEILCKLIRESWDISDIRPPDDIVNKTHKFILVRYE
jgi:hypothetical protein